MCRVLDAQATGRRLKELCKKQGIGVEDIRKELRLSSERTVYYWFNGAKMPSIDNLYMLAKLLGVTVDEILVGK